jgi:predicted dehydrogenase/threonine dehydrogenase-like Zn-dependent dehydrogenase
MKQILHSLRNGVTSIAEVPCPAPRPGELLIGSTCSLVSGGTERMLVDFGRSSLLGKVRQQPDKVQQVLEKARTDGVFSALEAVRSKLDQPLSLGYCNVGRVLEVGASVQGFAVGERVVSNGKHAEAVVVPKNLCARVPDTVDDESASFTVLGAIALQGIRLLQPTLGETVVVSGLGLIGLMAVQILRASGCRVLGIDMDSARLAMARKFGAECVDLGRDESPVAAALTFSRGRGVDAVLITASTTSSEPVAQAAHMCRKRGRIVLVGVTGLELSRADFYEKELSFQVSCSYGPGRYDPLYEESGHDYPVGYVRWTEQRNFEAVLDLMASGALNLQPLVSHRFTLGTAEQAYNLLASGAPSLGILLTYPESGGEVISRLRARTVSIGTKATRPAANSAPVVGVIGAGSYAGRVLIPAFKRAGVTLHTLVSAGGVSAAYQGGKQGFERASTDASAMLADPAIDTVLVATRHDSHASLLCSALEAGKHVFVEKPLAVTEEEVAKIEATIARTTALLMVGFNRRFAPQVVKMHELLSGVREPKVFIMTVNAGAIPAEHWTQDVRAGGGRIIGEACHFIDLLRHLANSPITSQQVAAIRSGTGLADRVTFTLGFADESIGTVHYLSNGHRAFPKERLEVFSGGRVLQLDNFRHLKGYGWPGFKRLNLWRQDKGQEACAEAFVEAVRNGGPSPIPLNQLLEVAKVTIAVARSTYA